LENHTSKLFEKFPLKISTNLLKLIFLHIYLFVMKLHTKVLLFLGDMDDYITLTNVPNFKVICYKYEATYKIYYVHSGTLVIGTN